ncbi:MAG: hypothetical protein QM744_16440 [Mesorhizobium sp.]
MRNFDFSSWQAVLTTLLGVALFALISMGIRLLMMFTVQQRRERMNRQINERLRTLIAAYKTLGGSFTGNLAVNPSHLRDQRSAEVESPEASDSDVGIVISSGSERSRRIRDAVEAALADIILLGTEEQVRLAERVARDMVAGRPVHTAELVVSLRNFIRLALDLGPLPTDLQVPVQGPVRPSSSSSSGKSNRQERQQGGGSGKGGGMGMGAGMGAGLGVGSASILHEDDAAQPDDAAK